MSSTVVVSNSRDDFQKQKQTILARDGTKILADGHNFVRLREPFRTFIARPVRRLAASSALRSSLMLTIVVVGCKRMEGK